jgi:hypothetical protein
MGNGLNLWLATKDSRDEQQGLSAIRVQRNWVQLGSIASLTQSLPSVSL